MGMQISHHDYQMRGMSSILRQWPLKDIGPGGRVPGVVVYDDFHNVGAALSSNRFSWQGGDLGSHMQWNAFGSTGVTLLPDVTAEGADFGVAEIDLDADDEQFYLAPDATYGDGPVFRISDATDYNYPCIFETRMQFGDVASGAAAIAKCCGLATPSQAAADAIGANGADLSGLTEFVGFRALAADGDGMDCVYQSTTEAVAEEAADNSSLVISADTWYVFTIMYDGTYLHYFVDGRRIKTIDPGVLPSATNFPDGADLVPFIGLRQHGTVDVMNRIDYVAAAQIHLPGKYPGLLKNR